MEKLAAADLYGARRAFSTCLTRYSCYSVNMVFASLTACSLLLVAADSGGWSQLAASSRLNHERARLFQFLRACQAMGTTHKITT